MTSSLSARGDLIEVRPLLPEDVDGADRICRLAFGTFLGAPDPVTVFGDTDALRTRWRADPMATLGAHVGGELVGSNVASNWGSVGFFGPLSVHPDWWDQGIARRLLEPTMDLFSSWGTRHAGLYTFAGSPKHIGLYQHYGFWPRYLTAVMAAPVIRPGPGLSYGRYSELAPGDRDAAKRELAGLTGAILEGLDVGREVEAVAAQGLGETIFVDDNSGLAAVAVCHVGPGTEAGSGSCYVKFAAARPGPAAARSFARLLEAGQDLAARAGATVLTAGVNLGREEAFAALRRRGFATRTLGVAMHRPNEAAYSTSGSYVIDDWR
jgi:GNAT superfamily N-acetyltransferase